MTLIFTDPIAAKLYIDEFAPKSIKPITPFLWTSKKPEAEYGDDFNAFTDESEIRELSLDELTPDLIDSDLKQIRVDPAIFVKGYAPQGEATGGVLVFTHDQENGSTDYWSNSLLLFLPDDDALTRFINQLTIEGDYVFNEKKA